MDRKPRCQPSVKTHRESEASETGTRQEVASSPEMNPLPRDEQFVIISMTGSFCFSK